MKIRELLGLQKRGKEEPRFEDQGAVAPPSPPYKTWAEMYHREPFGAYNREFKAMFQNTELDTYHLARMVHSYDKDRYVRDALRYCLGTQLVTPTQIGIILQNVLSRFPLYGGDIAEMPLHQRKPGFVHHSELGFANLKKFMQLLEAALKVLTAREQAGEVSREEVRKLCEELGVFDFFLWLENDLIDFRNRVPTLANLLDDKDLTGGTYWSDEQRRTSID